MMEHEQNEKTLLEQGQMEFKRNTENLRRTSKELFDNRRKFYEWRSKLVELIKTSGTVEARSHDARNYNQSFHFTGKTEIGESPIIGELRYGDDFHKADGTPLLLSYTSYRYGNDNS